MRSKISETLLFKTWGVLSVGLVLVGAIFYYTITLKTEVARVEDVWLNFSEQASDLTQNLNDLNKSLGYGGFIHNFKNYVLRREETYAIQASVDLANAVDVLTQLEETFVDNAKAVSDIAFLRATIQEYKSALAFSRQQPEDMSVAELDRIIKVDDTAAFTAIDNLSNLVKSNFEARKAESQTEIERIRDNINIGLFMAAIVLFGVLAQIWMFRRLDRVSQQEAKERQHADALLDGAPEAMLAVDSDGIIIRANIAASQMLEYSNSELVGMQVDQLVPNEVKPIHPEYRKRFAKEVGRRDMGGGSGDLVTVTKSGILVESDISLSNAFIEGEPFTIVTIRDVGSQRKAAKELERARQEADAVLDGAPEAMLVVGPDGIIIRANLAASQMLEYAIDELVGLQVDQLVPNDIKPIHPGYRKRFAKEVGRRDMGGGSGDLVTVTKSGILVESDISLSNAFIEGEPFTIATIRDVSSQRKAAKELERARQESDKANAMKSAFLASMSHEIRTPLTGLLGMADLLEMTDLDEKQLSFMKTLKKSGRHLEAILNDILDLSKLQAEKLMLNIELIEPVQLVETVKSVYGAIARSKSLDFQITITPDLDNKVLYGDILRLRQILMNLVGNAVKYTKTGSVKVTVGLKKDDLSDQAILVTVTDTGIGIAAEDLRRIFDPFFQVEDHLTKSFGGTGLGLAICNQLLSLMGGSLSATSEPGQGSIFIAEIPMRIETDRRVAQRAYAEKPINDVPPSGKAVKKVLIADDNEINRSLVTEIVSKWGHETEVAVDGQEALEKLIGNDYDIVLMDIHMPKLDGMEVLARATEQGRKPAKIFAFTADVMTESLEDYKNRGFDGVLPKPINWKLLSSFINGTEQEVLNQAG